MANNVLNTRIIFCNDTSVTWASSDKVLLKGEMAIEFPKSGAPKFKFGDGTNTFANLPYSAMTPDEVSAAIKSGGSGSGGSGSTNVETSPYKGKTIVAFGDSVVAGWGWKE